MARTRTRLDRANPCGVCGAPWKVIEVGIEVAELQGPVMWSPHSAGCSRGAEAHDIDAYNAELARRRGDG